MGPAIGVLASDMAAEQQPSVEWQSGDQAVVAAGPFDLDHVARLSRQCTKLAGKARDRCPAIDVGGITRLDTAGAWLLERLRRELSSPEREADFANVRDEHRRLLDTMRAVSYPDRDAERRYSPLLQVANRTGRAFFKVCHEAVSLLSFFGQLAIRLGRVTVQPRRIRFRALVHHLEATGLNAMPIVGLLSLLIGVVLAYQGASQLQQFGAEIFVVNLLAVSILRELGGLVTAIMVAGRSGSAFTAQIGTMKVNQEVDAMNTLGLDPIEVLVIPRVVALLIALPLLTFFADVVGILGGALISYMVLDIDFGTFLRQLQASVELETFFAGLIKAPFFAFIIGMVGCYHGLRVSGSSESVGRHTTSAVVEAITLVIILDAIFSILFAELGF